MVFYSDTQAKAGLCDCPACIYPAFSGKSIRRKQEILCSLSASRQAKNQANKMNANADNVRCKR